jgi:hypothetical protein
MERYANLSGTRTPSLRKQRQAFLALLRAAGAVGVKHARLCTAHPVPCCYCCTWHLQLFSRLLHFPVLSGGLAAAAIAAGAFIISDAISAALPRPLYPYMHTHTHTTHVSICAQEGIPEEYDVIFVGSLSVDVDVMEQEVRTCMPLGRGCPESHTLNAA